MNKVWFQLTGSHGTGQPQQVLHAAGRFFIGGYHTMDDPNLQKMKEDRINKREYNFLGLKHTRQSVICPSDVSGYPKYSWWYDNKLEGQKAFQCAQQILRFDPRAHLIYFSCIPMMNTLILARLLKANLSGKFTMIHYKRYFWNDQVTIPTGIQRVMINNQVVPDGMQHLMSRKIQQQLVRMSDIAYLADSFNINGELGMDSDRKIAQMQSFRDAYLTRNPKIKLFSMRNKVYQVYDSI